MDYNLDDLNRQMMELNSEYNIILQQNQKQQLQPQKIQGRKIPENINIDYSKKINEVNFQHVNGDINKMENIIGTQQIKKSFKSDENRSEMNDKINRLISFNPLPPEDNNGLRHNLVHSRIDQKNINKNQIINNYSREENNKRLNDYQTNDYKHISGIMGNDTTTMNNIYFGNGNNILERKGDYRQNMNNKIDNFIFDNPVPQNPILQQKMNTIANNNLSGKDNRMIIQDSNKDFYRQAANARMAEYSPLSRSANCPISMASMSVNDFYSNSLNNTISENIEEDARDVLNSRLNNYAPLATTINLQQYNQPQYNSQTHHTSSPLDNIFNATKYNGIGIPTIQQKQWNDVNQKMHNPVFSDFPVNSNKF